MYGASGNALDDQGNLYQASFYGNTIVKINRYNNEVTEVAHQGLSGPVGLTFKENELFICNSRGNFIAKLDSNKNVVQFAKSPLFNCPNGITVGPQGNLYVVNYSDPNISKINKDGEVSLFAKLPAPTGGHIHYFESNFYATSFFGHKIFKISTDGKIAHIAGSGKLGIKNGKGLNAEFSFPNGIYASKGAIFVNDKIIDPNGGPLKTVIRKISLPDLTNLLMKAINSQDIEAAKKSYIAFKEHSLFKNDNTENSINALGYNLLTRKNYKFAIAVFKMNTESYPKSWNVWDSLAEAYLLNGDKVNAKKHFLQSLKINPQNTNASDKLEKL
jgi:DNA-binding beta-propeller fold protein YncE